MDQIAISKATDNTCFFIQGNIRFMMLHAYQTQFNWLILYIISHIIKKGWGWKEMKYFEYPLNSEEVLFHYNRQKW